jgi:hypothetical protein
VDDDQPITIERLFDELRARLPDVEIERVKVKWPADDDNLWYIRSGGDSEVQIGCRPEGRGPFLIEGDDPRQRVEAAHADEAVDAILEWLTPR